MLCLQESNNMHDEAMEFLLLYNGIATGSWPSKSFMLLMLLLLLLLACYSHQLQLAHPASMHATAAAEAAAASAARQLTHHVQAR